MFGIYRKNRDTTVPLMFWSIRSVKSNYKFQSSEPQITFDNQDIPYKRINYSPNVLSELKTRKTQK